MLFWGKQLLTKDKRFMNNTDIGDSPQMKWHAPHMHLESPFQILMLIC